MADNLEDVIARVASLAPNLGAKLFRWAGHQKIRRSSELAMSLEQTFREVGFDRNVDPRALTEEFVTAKADIRCMQRHLLSMSPTRLRRFVADVHVDSDFDWETLLDSAQPIVGVASHFGHYALTTLKMALMCEGRRECVMFYNPPDLNPFSESMTELINRLGAGTKLAINQKGGTISAYRALQKGAMVGIMPDFSAPALNCVYIPFFGHFYAVMPGAATFALKSAADIVTMHCSQTEDIGVVAKFRYLAKASKTKELAGPTYQLTLQMFEYFEQLIREDPAFWMFWPEFSQRVRPNSVVPVGAEEWRGEILKILPMLREFAPEIATELQSLVSNAAISGERVAQ